MVSRRLRQLAGPWRQLVHLGHPPAFSSRAAFSVGVIARNFGQFLNWSLGHFSVPTLLGLSHTWTSPQSGQGPRTLASASKASLEEKPSPTAFTSPTSTTSPSWAFK